MTSTETEGTVETVLEYELEESAKYSRGFWVDLADRTISSAAGAALALATAVSFDLLKPDLAGILAVVGTAALISVLKALAVAK